MMMAADSNSGIRDWAWLPKNIIALILTKVTESFGDYIRFCGVCAPWRHVAMEEEEEHALQKRSMLRILKTCHNQLPMLLLVPADDSKPMIRHNLYSITEGRFYHLPISQLPNYENRSFFASSHGWLFCMERDMCITLFNPFYPNNTIRLPMLKPPNNEFEDWIHNNKHRENCVYYFIDKGILSSDPGLNLDTFEVGIMYGRKRKLAFFKSGDVAWTFAWTERDYLFSDLIYKAGRFYAVNDSNGIVRIDLASRGPHDRIIIHPSARAGYEAEASYLVESQEGDVLVVQRFWELTNDVEDRFWIYTLHKDEDPVGADTNWFEVFKLVWNPLQGCYTQLVRIKSLGDQALFLGHNHSVCVSALDFPGCRPNCIYYTDQIHRDYLPCDWPVYPHGPDDDSGIFNVERKKFELNYMPSNYSHKHLHPPIWFIPNLRGSK